MTRAIQAGTDFVVQMDSDLSHGPGYLPQMLGVVLSADADVVIGSRYVAGASVAGDWSWHRRLLSSFAQLLCPRAAQSRSPGCHGGLQALAQLRAVGH